MRLLILTTFSWSLVWMGIPGTIVPHQKVLFSDTSVSSGYNELFDNDSVLHFRISGNIQTLFNDRYDDAQYHPVVLSYKKNDSTVYINLKAKTRGNFRRRKENCTFPPILLNFSKQHAQSSLFENMDKLKLVCPCRSENYIVREYLVYKLYNLLTPQSFKARLVRVTFEDRERSREITFFGILLEQDEQMALRNKSVLVHTMNTHGNNIESGSFLRMAMFQYLIGNTDWSTEYFHNTRLMALDSLSMPSVVPYDFDHSGIVNAPYAMPAEELALNSIQDRRYRGYCIPDLGRLDGLVTTFNQLKKDFYNIYYNCPYLDAKYVKSTIQYMDQFYATINDPRKFKSEFGYPCKKGVPNIVIKGLGKN